MSDIISIQSIMQRCADFSASEVGQIPSAWKRVVSRVHSFSDSEDAEKRMPLGERLAGNTHAVDLKNGVLLVETDHSGWIQYLRIYQKFILKGLQMECPELKIKSLAFRVAGSDVNLHDNYEHDLKKSREEMDKKIEANEKQIQKFYDENGLEKKPENEGSSNLPPELLAKFDSIRQSMLTNNDK